MAFPQVPAHQQAEMMARMEEMQTKESLRSYNMLVERCFTHCVSAFRSKSLDAKETTCIERCAEKFMKNTQRVGQRFAELQAATVPMPPQ
mmetsp:Transcript_24499/g.48676  ORF Transcript_24499/g.48676 Transcript_24499/m.48676 type:complete len:90 (+) Transcript_24499:65-334(+)|eukprot:CAMPEP_0182467702 /NCGR_PEP_ID=MMETSP1319-20130603/14430_1 /TAXON_ID=172717 /ORGANISM="Bolidomonas pacifica, Strain RCC208" /LENGTH=89 /DNA_ID=CAMNT_0024667821 /DNA_START=47 /DNA_END=316 /DNA_ORIENTATION=+